MYQRAGRRHASASTLPPARSKGERPRTRFGSRATMFLAALLFTACSPSQSPAPASIASSPSAASSAQGPSATGIGSAAASPGAVSSGGGTGVGASSLSWTPCSGVFECATLAVPLDYGKPDGKAIDLALIRLPAA